MLDIFLIIAPLFVIIFAAAILRRTGFIADDWSLPFNQFALNIGLPAMVFLALAQTTIVWRQEFSLIGINAAFIIVVMLVSYAVARIMNFSDRMRDTVIVCLMFSNVAYLGIPILTQVYGTDTLSQVSIIVAVYLFGLFGVGVTFLALLHRKPDASPLRSVIRTLATNPLLLAIAAGILINILRIDMPLILTEALRMLSSAVTPVVLIVIGVFIGQTQLGSVKEWGGVALFTLVSLIGLPALFLAGCALFGAPAQAHYLSIVESAMPLGITPFALADKYNLRKSFIARSIVLGTAFSMITLPFWISIVGQ